MRSPYVVIWHDLSVNQTDARFCAWGPFEHFMDAERQLEYVRQWYNAPTAESRIATLYPENGEV